MMRSWLCEDLREESCFRWEQYQCKGSQAGRSMSKTERRGWKVKKAVVDEMKSERWAGARLCRALKATRDFGFSSNRSGEPREAFETKQCCLC